MLHCIRYVWCFVPIFLLTGCWQKIEYKGKLIAAAKAPATPKETTSTAVVESKPVGPQAPAPPLVDTPVRTSAADAARASAPVADATPAAPATEFQPAAATPIPSAAMSSPPVAKASPEDDRYATPPKGLEQSANSKFVPPEIPKSSSPESPQPKRHTDATAVSATVEVEPRGAVSPKLRQAVWILGSRLSLAALAHDRRMAANSVPTWLDEARSACQVLGTSVAELPEPAVQNDPAPASQQVIRYLLDQGQRIGPDLSKRFGPKQSALFEVALKSNLLLFLYSPGSDATTSISAAIVRAAPTAELPDILWYPLIERVNNRASLDEVRTAVRTMHRDVDSYLAKAAEPGTR
jgi:hypothetical protein